MVIERTARLSLHTLLTALSGAGCGQPHEVFAGGARYVPPEAARQVNQEALNELADAGLTTGGRPSEAFEDAIHVLARPERECYAHIRTGDEQFSVLVAARGRTAVTALHQDRRVWLNPADDRDLEGTLVAHLPEFPAAGFTTFSLSQRDFRRDENGVTGVYDEPEARSPEARELDDIFSVRHYGFGYLHVARSKDGTRHASVDTLSYLDIDAGRIGLEMSGPRGSQQITVFPGQPATLAARLADLQARVA
ncbi:ESX secretion-associated protein EspG [Amycolatopsis palatopharyngis]|uniref:ESX secretion-associated protein EspG n=1 Tax=Amycolatopsis palatopharyngis TaxID=187982 RepID=UPI0013BEA87D|nr:ESX secretion-associated protein EspG [Amycolatopsis palatopharyngis]